MLAVVWQFDVQVGSEEEFEKLHGADGAWTALSRRSRSFLGSSFLKDLATPGRYLLLEYWSEMMVYEKHLADFSDTVDELKAQRTAMVKETVALGVFDALDVPERYGPTWSVRDRPPIGEDRRPRRRCLARDVGLARRPLPGGTACPRWPGHA